MQKVESSSLFIRFTKGPAYRAFFSVRRRARAFVSARIAAGRIVGQEPRVAVADDGCSEHSLLRPELAQRAAWAVEREGRRLGQFRVVDPIGAPTRPAQTAQGPALDASCDVGLSLAIPAPRVHLIQHVRPRPPDRRTFGSTDPDLWRAPNGGRGSSHRGEASGPGQRLDRYATMCQAVTPSPAAGEVK
jgi:hypothetical protein